MSLEVRAKGSIECHISVECFVNNNAEFIKPDKGINIRALAGLVLNTFDFPLDA